MSLREHLVKDCQTNKGITGCEQCEYEDACNQVHINLIIKAVKSWLQKADFIDIIALLDEPETVVTDKTTRTEGEKVGQ